jgi:hypothetical protein
MRGCSAVASYTLLTRVIEGLAAAASRWLISGGLHPQRLVRAERTRARRTKSGPRPSASSSPSRLTNLCVCATLLLLHCIASHHNHTLPLLIHLLAHRASVLSPPLCLHLQTRLHSLASVQPASFNLTQVSFGECLDAPRRGCHQYHQTLLESSCLEGLSSKKYSIMFGALNLTNAIATVHSLLYPNQT